MALRARGGVPERTLARARAVARHRLRTLHRLDLDDPADRTAIEAVCRRAWSPSWCASGGPRSTSPPSRASSPRSRPWNPRPRGTRDRQPAQSAQPLPIADVARALPRRPRHGRRGRRRDAGVPRAGVREHPRGRSRAVRGRPRARQDARRAEPRCRLRPRLPRLQCTPDLLPRRHHRVVRLRPGDHRVRLPTGAGVHRDVPRRRDQPHVTEDPVGAPRGDGRGPGHGRGRGLPAPPAVPRRRDVEPDRVRGHLRPAGGPTRPLHGAALGRVPPPARASSRSSSTGSGAARRSRRSRRWSTRPTCCACRRRSRACTSTRTSRSTASTSRPRHGPTATCRSGRRRAGAQALMLVGRARAVMDGRDFVTPEDVKTAAVAVLAHRISLTPQAWANGVDPALIVRASSRRWRGRRWSGRRASPAYRRVRCCRPGGTVSVPDGPSARPVAASTPLWVRNPALVFGLAAGVLLAGSVSSPDVPSSWWWRCRRS